MILAILTVFLIACKTTEIEATKLVYPKLELTDFPKPNGQVIPLDKNKNVVRDNDTKIETVEMPYWYFMLVFDKFAYNYKTQQLEYKAFLEEVEKNK